MSHPFTEQTPATHSIRSAVVDWVRACLIVVVGAVALALLAPGPGAGAATIASGHAAVHGPSNAKPVKKHMHQPAAITATQVKISNFKFGPRTLTVKVGTKVTWTNKDLVAHSVNFASGKINSKTLDQNAKFSHTFTTPGTYPYICAIHPFMHGTIVVTA
jgi:amicyanin